jgi:hypothetical protein
MLNYPPHPALRADLPRYAGEVCRQVIKAAILLPHSEGS